jgi:two-component system cell cycle sensor histidine kinase/response regulator CckA
VEGSQGSKSVLVVDDEPAVLDIITSILEANGFSIIRATGGMAALEESRGKEDAIMLLITDVVMPDLNGPHLAEHLCRRIPGLRVMFMSGWEPQVIAHEGAFRHGYRTLCKPFTAAALLETVRTVLAETPPGSVKSAV